ncbi:MAG: hypothetical protein VKJ09_07100, partial [Leptolyngbya sp.]|nr:hypothetical protein [Leptolyngbya sp.]
MEEIPIQPSINPATLSKPLLILWCGNSGRPQRGRDWISKDMAQGQQLVTEQQRVLNPVPPAQNSSP